MKKTILIAAVMFFAFSVAAFAQAQLQVSSQPVTAVSSCGTMELTGPIAFAQTTAAPITTGTISINYGVPIVTIVGNNPPVATVTITDGAVPPTVISTTTLNSTNVAGNVLTFNVLPIVGGVPPYTIQVSGVRVNIAGTPNLTSLSAVVSGTGGNLFVGGPPPVIVISSISPSLGNLTVPSPQTILAVSPTFGTSNVVQVEGFANAFVQNAMVQFTFTGVPAGLTLSVPLIVSSTRPATPPATGTTPNEPFVLVNANGVAASSGTFTSTGAPINIFYLLTTPASDNLQFIETLSIPVTIGASTVTPPVSPLPAATITVTTNIVGIAPTGTNPALPPQFTTACQKGPVTVATIVTASTNLLMPYATTLAGYDTGIAIANTTAEPTPNPFVPPAPDQSGTITFWLFPASGTSFSITPTAGGGLTNGVLVAGSEYVNLLSSILADAGKPAAFSGYIFVICNFTQAHGQYFISNFDSFTNGALMLVLPNSRANPESLGN